ncbi:MAG: pyruvate, phosphate dikinase [Deltaproteobacteria bacterium]|nr:pyruvate, phosphate dikinase [Deltaproteobacteria bacterium]
MAKKWVYFFGAGEAEGGASQKPLLGSKGAGLAEMTRLGVPVPAGFTVSTEVCAHYTTNGQTYPGDLRAQVGEAMAKVERAMNAKFGDAANPLLVSVRSGAIISMPGMMDTVLNLGLNAKTVEGMARATQNPRFAWDSYRRFIQMYGDVVMRLGKEKFEHIFSAQKKKRGVAADTELSADDLREVASLYKGLVRDMTGTDFPEAVDEQLWGAIGAVFRSWNNDRAVTYRKLNKIPDDLGTAVSVVAMVYGNMGNDSATGVAFTRDPATGERRFFGEYLLNAQGEDVVAGIRTPIAVAKLADALPEAYRALDDTQKKLERHYRDMQDIEFTIQRGKLWMLQTRTGKRTGFAAVRIAVEMVDEGLISKDEALARVPADTLVQLLMPVFEGEAKTRATKEGRQLTKGLAAGPGAANGKAVFSAVEAERRHAAGEQVILVRAETSPEDIRGMAVAEAIVTGRGGMTSHAAVVARGMGKCCVVGCGELAIDEGKRQFATGKGNAVVREGDAISVDGTTGEVFAGGIPTHPSEVIQVAVEGKKAASDAPAYQLYAKLMGWADEARRLKVRANADTPHDAEVARKLGAEGIGLCRTEHMFFEGTRIDAMRELILSDDEAGQRRALAKLLPMQRGDFKGIFGAMTGLPVTIRLLDPPLHEFLPHTDDAIAELAKASGVPVQKIKDRAAALAEFNPMLGLRGCRLGLTQPLISEMQVRAIMEAAVTVKRDGLEPIPEIMIPLVGLATELERARTQAVAVAEAVLKEAKLRVNYTVGTMIELPRACVVADKIAEQADFFSFGTNDLTQTTFGLSRDDAGRFLPWYVDAKLLPVDPFVSIDRAGVGGLMKLAAEKGRSVKPNLKLGICGEHGGDPESVEFCHTLGLDYVSCSPYRVPIARLAAARACVAEKK